MKPYVLRRLKGIVDPVSEKPMLFHSKGYLSDLDSMIQAEYVAQLDTDYNKGNSAMVKMLVDLELIEKEK